MAKKVYDILPPQVAKKVKEVASALPLEHKRKRTTRRKPPTPKIAPVVAHIERTVFPWRKVFIGGVLVIMLVIVGYLYVKLPKADITIWPKTESVTLQEKIATDTSVTKVDVDKKIIPGRLIEEEQEGSQEFPATGMGSDSTKATGTITIYNKISPASSFSLKIGTHFLSDSGKYFITLSNVTIPAMSGKNPGKISVKVQAQDPGPDSNIGASKFSIPKLTGTAYYYTIWGESTSDMTGGTASNFKKVTQDDLDAAKTQLTKRLMDQADQLLHKKIGDGEVLLNGATTQIVVSAAADTKANITANSFRETAKVKVSALVFKQSDVNELAKHDLAAKLPGSQSIRENTIVAQYDPDLIDMTKGTERVNLTASATAYYDIGTNELRETVARKSASQIEDMISRMYDGKVTKTTIHFWPFWVKKAPTNQERVKVDLEFE